MMFPACHLSRLRFGVLQNSNRPPPAVDFSQTGLRMDQGNIYGQTIVTDKRLRALRQTR